MSAKQTNEIFEQFFSQFANADAFKQFDLNKASSIAQQNFEAASKANKIWLEGAQKIAKQQVEFTQDVAQQFANAASKALSAKSPEENIESSTKLAQDTVEAGIQNVQSIAKSASKVSVDAFDVINKQSVKNLNEASSFAEAS